MPCVCCAPTRSSGEQVTAWTEDFNGDSLNPDDWNIQVGNDDRNIGSCRNAYCQADNIGVADGKLTITSRRQESHGYNYTTGGVTTQSKRRFSYDPAYRLCVSAKLPGGDHGQGIWPGGVMYP